VGAGRPSKGERVVLSVRIDREVAERLKELATEREMTQGEVVEVAIMRLKRGYRLSFFLRNILTTQPQQTDNKVIGFAPALAISLL
jgi:hypothetical protein